MTTAYYPNENKRINRGKYSTSFSNPDYFHLWELIHYFEWMSSQFYDPITYYVEQLFFVNLPRYRYRYLQYIHTPSTNKFVDSTSMIMRASPAHAQFNFIARFFFETCVLSLSVVSIKIKNYLFQHTPSFYRYIVINILYFTSIYFYFLRLFLFIFIFIY